MEQYDYSKHWREIEDLLTIADCAEELLKFQCTYEKDSPAWVAWLEMRDAVAIRKRRSDSATDVKD